MKDEKYYPSFAEQEAHQLKVEAHQEERWSQPISIPNYEIIKCFVDSINQAISFEEDKTQPYNFDEVVKYITYCVNDKWKHDISKTTIKEIADLFKEWTEEHPSFRQWGSFTFKNRIIHGTCLFVLARRIKEHPEEDETE